MKSNLEKELLNSIDEYLLSGREEVEDDNSDLFNIGKELIDRDISLSDLGKKRVYKRMEDKIKGEEKHMKKTNIIYKRLASLVLVGVMGIGLMQTSFAQDMYDRVKKVLSLRYVSVEESIYKENETYKVPSELKGKLFDENGIELTEVKEDSKIFDSEGYEIDNIELGEDIILSRADDKEDKYIYINSIDEARSYLKFNLQVPKSLPEGYKFKSVSFYGDKKEDIEGEYATLIYANGDKEFYLSERLASKENGFEAGGRGIKEVNINGNKAIVDKKGNIDIEIDDSIVSLLTLGNITRDEAIDVITSIK